MVTIEKSHILFWVSTSIKTVTPWKIRIGSDEYQRGWNDCVKDIRKRRKKLELNIKKDVL